MKKYLIVQILSLVLITLVFLSETRAQALEFPETDYQGLIVKVNQVDLKISEYSGKTIKVVGITDKSQWSFKTDGLKILTLEEKTFDQGRDDVMRQKLIIQVPSINVSVFAAKVDLQIENLKKDFKLNAISGKVRIVNSQGDENILLTSGEISWENSSGKVIVEGDQLRTVAKNSNLDMDIKVQTLKLEEDKNQGHQQIQCYQGQINLSQTSGGMVIDAIKGSVSSISHQGRLEFTSEDANLEVRLTKDSELIARTKAGKVFVNTNGVTGVFLNLKAQEGDVYLPGAMRPNKNKQESSFKGRTLGEKTLTKIEVKTNNAAIIIK
ncbi:MAG: hypothetical protein HUU56_03955 [Bdellovibrionaceae bacterium]|nr:hypothetical protein [Pseudobdellovibrionaceae bacterium]